MDAMEARKRENTIYNMLNNLPRQKGLHILLFVLCVQLPRRKSVIKWRGYIDCLIILSGGKFELQASQAGNLTKFREKLMGFLPFRNLLSDAHTAGNQIVHNMSH